jgi:hypothetical protein
MALTLALVESWLSFTSSRVISHTSVTCSERGNTSQLPIATEETLQLPAGTQETLFSYLHVRYTRESLPLHPPIRRIFSFNQNK